MGIKPTLDSGLWSGDWRRDVGRATLGKCQMRLTSLWSSVTCEKNSGAQAWKCAAQTLHFSAHTEKIRGNIAHHV